jgi:GH25 family lysozyme M1 (1,4-beta-N-acetylmuramidase)
MTDPKRPSPFVAACAAIAVLAAFWLASGSPASAHDPTTAAGRSDRRDGTAGSSGEAGPRGRAALAVQPPDSLPGIDVSHYQHEIDWTQVAASGIRFAFQKATEGTGYVDPTYATNRAGATANGIVFGAYHFARPDLHPFDPVPEADHFVDTAQLGQGNLLPVLDLERSGDLSQEELTAWIIGWLNRVYERTGVRAIVYTSPNGWLNRTGDTTAVADSGYTTLWVAHWDTPTPRVPANDWQANGWTFWQYSNCESIPGIEGCVDGDWFDGLDLTPYTIPSPDTTAPVASLATPTGVVGPVTITFSEIVLGVTPENVAIRELDSGIVVPSAITCWSKAGTQVDCVAGKLVTVVVTPPTPMIPGKSYAVAVNPPGAAPIVDRNGNVAPSAEQSFSMPTDVEQGSPAVGYAWRSVSAGKAFGGSYAVERGKGAAASFAFTGRQVTWITVAGPAFGRATVLIDGRARGTFDQYATSPRFKEERTFRGLAPGSHTIMVRATGTRSSIATDSLVAIDAFRTGGKTIWTPALTGSWRTQRAGPGTAAVSDLGRASATFAFHGTGVRWRTARGPFKGRAEVWVDGTLVKTVDNFAPAPQLTMRTIDGLAPGTHTLRIVVLGSARPAAQGAEVTVDGFTVLP